MTRPLLNLMILAIVGTTGAAASNSAETAKLGKEKLVCSRYAATGTRFTHKVCKTKLEWDEASEKARRGFEETQNRPVINQKDGG